MNYEMRARAFFFQIVKTTCEFQMRFGSCWRNLFTSRAIRKTSREMVGCWGLECQGWGWIWNWVYVLNESVVSFGALLEEGKIRSTEKSGSEILSFFSVFFLRTRYKTPNGATSHLVQCGKMGTDSMPYSVSAATSHVNRNREGCPRNVATFME